VPTLALKSKWRLFVIRPDSNVANAFGTAPMISASKMKLPSRLQSKLRMCNFMLLQM
jgi:hypothetical protein